MKKYLSFFRLRFAMGLQYRTAALAGITTQFAWGFMEIMIFHAFYRADAASFPMHFFFLDIVKNAQHCLVAILSKELCQNTHHTQIVIVKN